MTRAPIAQTVLAILLELTTRTTRRLLLAATCALTAMVTAVSIAVAAVVHPVGGVAVSAVLIGTVLEAAGVAALVDRLVLQPLEGMRRTVDALAAGNQAVSFEMDQRGELGDMAVALGSLQQQMVRCTASLDASIERLLNVSQALTTTTGGIQRLRDAVLATTSALAGAGATSMLFIRRDGALELAGCNGAVRDAVLGPEHARQLMEGGTVRIAAEFHHVLALPMYHQEAVVGALLTITLTKLDDSEERTLQALANNAAVALENTRLFEQEKETVARLTQLNRLKTDLLSTVQHELRTPVLAIQGQIELLRAGWDRWDDRAKLDLLRDVDASTRMMSDLVETIVDFSLLNADTVQLQLQRTEVAATAHHAADDVRAHFAGGLPVSLTVDVPSHLTVRADPRRLRQALRAVLDNAVKFTPPGGSVMVTAGAGDQRCRIEVSDTGVGIGGEALDRVFEPFYQEDTSRTRKHGGMGLGLALVRSLCVAHGAAVAIVSERGHGTAVVFDWPLADAATPAGHGDEPFHMVDALRPAS